MNPIDQAQGQQTTGGVTPSIPKRGKLLRLPAVIERTGLGRSSIYAGIRAGTFVVPLRLSARAVGFPEEEIERWIATRVVVSRQPKSPLEAQ